MFGGGGRSYDGEAGDDDDEWYPPSPPVYDVADKLIEINKTLYDDPFSTTHEVTNSRVNHSCGGGGFHTRIFNLCNAGQQVEMET